MNKISFKDFKKNMDAIMIGVDTLYPDLSAEDKAEKTFPFIAAIFQEFGFTLPEAHEFQKGFMESLKIPYNK